MLLVYWVDGAMENKQVSQTNLNLSRHITDASCSTTLGVYRQYRQSSLLHQHPTNDFASFSNVSQYPSIHSSISCNTSSVVVFSCFIIGSVMFAWRGSYDILDVSHLLHKQRGKLTVPAFESCNTTVFHR